ncbi:hypothetical protein GALMADRAFT_41664, partial [Galerina marginata CBS 339.88]
WIKGSLSPQEIRDRIMDKSSDFQRKMVEYLEAVHMGEPVDSTLAEVQALVKAKEKNADYCDPTKTMPQMPPPLCTACQGPTCSNCQNINTWWDYFKHTTNDILSRSNYHSCRATTETKDGRSLRKGCLNSKGECKARFPREVIEKTMVEPLTGALRIKKGEPWMNTFTPSLSYLMRCNTDVTSLLSGTAIKAIVAYVTDYVTKPGLTTYSIFDTVKQVFSRNSEMIGGSTNRQEVARSLMTKMVNALTSKLEIGSPMASLYLLGNPDHYTQHIFKQFYWRPYVREVQSVWKTDEAENLPEKVVLNKNLGRYIGLSKVQDYTFRPDIYRNVSLYEWIRCAEKVKRSRKAQLKFDDLQDRLDLNKYSDDDNDDLDELDLLGQVGGGNNESLSSDELNINENNELTNDNPIPDKSNFLPEHPQFNTHQIVYKPDNLLVVPLFIGGSLPRRDQGDREYYCTTMLTLFKPWHTGYDLKNKNQTWDDAFNEYSFTQQQKKFMDNFNLRYECNDARDDYSAKLDKNPNKIFASWATDNDHSTFDNIDKNIETEEDENDTYHLLNDMEKSQEMDRIENVVKAAGWLNNSTDDKTELNANTFQPDQTITSSAWNTIVQTAKQLVLQKRSQNLPSNTGLADQLDQINSQNTDKVVVSDISYITKNFKAERKEKQQIIDRTVLKFSLNKEQERAFRIVANHASLHK